MFKLVRDLLLLAAIVYGISALLQRDMSSGQAPALSGVTINGQTITLASKDTTLVYFWGTWCPACKMTSSAVNQLNNDYAVISVAVASGSRQELRQYMAQKQYQFAVINDHSGLSQTWGASGLPAIYIVKNGDIKFVTRGVTTLWGLKWRLWLTSWLD